MLPVGLAGVSSRFFGLFPLGCLPLALGFRFDGMPTWMAWKCDNGIHDYSHTSSQKQLELSHINSISDYPQGNLVASSEFTWFLSDAKNR
jgi:hypothetical protein